MVGKASRPSPIPGEHGKWHSIWPTSNASANYRRQGEGGLLGGANSVFPTPATIINCRGTALDNLTLTAANNTTDLQQLKAAKLVLITSNATLTAANKKLSEALAKALATMLGMPREIRPNNKPFLGNYC